MQTGAHRLRLLRYIKEAASGFDLRVTDAGWIYSRPVRTAELTSAISCVAESSRKAADLIIRHFRPEIHSDFRREFDLFLTASFHKDLEKNPKIVGASNTPHNFDYLIRLPEQSRIVIDTVKPEANSINSAIVSHLDLKQARLLKTRQLIVYDDRVKWRASDLALLSVGATPVGYTRVPESLRRMQSELHPTH